MFAQCELRQENDGRPRASWPHGGHIAALDFCKVRRSQEMRKSAGAAQMATSPAPENIRRNRPFFAAGCGSGFPILTFIVTFGILTHADDAGENRRRLV